MSISFNGMVLENEAIKRLEELGSPRGYRRLWDLRKKNKIRFLEENGKRAYYQDEIENICKNEVPRKPYKKRVKKENNEDVNLISRENQITLTIDSINMKVLLLYASKNKSTITQCASKLFNQYITDKTQLALESALD